MGNLLRRKGLFVIAERKSPTMFVTDPMFEWLDLGDRFVSTYTYGPLGLITRTEEFDNWDTADNRDHYYLPDAYGGNVAMAVDHDGDPQTGRVAKFTISDTFGNAMDAAIPETGMYAWRGQEGSVTDSSPGLVLLFLRHYDPAIGRFIQADPLPVASFTSQGMNRFIYVENDPVNWSDPTGTIAGIVAVAIAFVAGMVFGAALQALGVNVTGGAKAIIASLLAMGLAACKLGKDTLNPVGWKQFLAAIALALGVPLAEIGAFGGGAMLAMIGLGVASFVAGMWVGALLVDVLTSAAPTAVDWFDATRPTEESQSRIALARSSATSFPKRASPSRHLPGERWEMDVGGIRRPEARAASAMC